MGAGFHQDLTGRENIFLNGAILGMSQRQIRRKFDEIVEFSGLEEFIDTPVKRYSSGMYARLGFSIAAHVEPDLLIVDEVLSVGDYLFQRKCVDRMKAVVSSGTTLLFVSHRLRALSEVCRRSLLLDRGRPLQVGSTDEVIRRYLDQGITGRGDTDWKDVYVSKVTIRGVDGRTAAFEAGSKVWVDLEIMARRPVQRLAVGLQITGEADIDAFSTSNTRLGADIVSLEAGQKLRCRFELELHLAPAVYNVTASVRRPDVGITYDRWAAATTFVVRSKADLGGIANLYPAIVSQWVRKPTRSSSLGAGLSQCWEGPRRTGALLEYARFLPELAIVWLPLSAAAGRIRTIIGHQDFQSDRGVRLAWVVWLCSASRSSSQSLGRLTLSGSDRGSP